MGDMTECESCGREIATGADRCPHCGRNRFPVGFLAILAAIILLAMLWNA